MVHAMRAAALSTLARDLGRAPSAARGVLMFGSWALNIASRSALLCDEVALLFRQTPDDVAAAAPRRGAATLHLLAGDVPAALESVIDQALPRGIGIPPTASSKAARPAWPSSAPRWYAC